MLNKKTSSEKRFVGHQTKKLQKGDFLFREGDLSREMYIVQTGGIEVFKTIENRKLVLTQIDRGGMVGEMSLLESLPRSASAQATTETSLLVLDLGSFLLKLRRDPTFAFELMKQLSGRVRATNEKLLALLADDQVSKINIKNMVDSNL